MGQKIDFVYLIATMPGRHSGDQVHKVKKTAAPLFLFFRYFGLNLTRTSSLLQWAEALGWSGPKTDPYRKWAR